VDSVRLRQVNLEETSMPSFRVYYLIWSDADESHPFYSNSVVVEAATRKEARRLSRAKIVKEHQKDDAWTEPDLQLVRIRELEDWELQELRKAASAKTDCWGMSIVVSGNPADGFSFYGPFPGAAEGNVWADRTRRNAEWWVARLEFPFPAPEDPCHTRRPLVSVT
jgi:hypothetical protein